MDNQDGQINGLNLHLDLKDVGGVWANFAAIKHSDYEFTIDFARLDFTPEGANGVVVSRVNISPLFVLQLIQALETNWSEYSKKAMPPEVRDNEGWISLIQLYAQNSTNTLRTLNVNIRLVWPLELEPADSQAILKLLG